MRKIFNCFFSEVDIVKRRIERSGHWGEERATEARDAEISSKMVFPYRVVSFFSLELIHVRNRGPGVWLGREILKFKGQYFFGHSNSRIH